jgi:hypothetical protein
MTRLSTTGYQRTCRWDLTGAAGPRSLPSIAVSGRKMRCRGRPRVHCRNGGPERRKRFAARLERGPGHHDGQGGTDPHKPRPYWHIAELSDSQERARVRKYPSA